MQTARKSTPNRSRMVAEYIAALRNEIAIEIAFLDSIGKKSTYCHFLPRSPRWIALSPCALRLLGFFAPLLRFFWTWLGFWIWLAYQCVSQSRGLHRQSEAPELLPVPQRCLFGVSERAFQVLSSPGFRSLSVAKLYCPWVAKPRGVDLSYSDLSLGDLLGWRDVLLCLQLSVRAHARIQQKFDLRLWIMQDYTALQWFLVRIALSRLPTHWVTTEHYDRWAVLVDCVVKEARREERLSRSAERHGFTLIQHGSLASLSYHNTAPVFPVLPYRLRCVRNLFVYSVETAEGFYNNVISRSFDPSLRVSLFKPTIALTTIAPTKRCKVLLVGHPACEDFHLRVMDLLERVPEMLVFYKPHPKNPMSKRAAKGKWQVLRNPSCFPDCELVIGYPSTLLMEYREAGVPILEHSMDEPMDRVDSIVNAVFDILKVTQTDSDK